MSEAPPSGRNRNITIIVIVVIVIVIAAAVLFTRSGGNDQPVDEPVAEMTEEGS